MAKNVFILSPVELCECGPEYRVRAVCVSGEMRGVTRILRSVLRTPRIEFQSLESGGTLYHAMISLIITLFCAIVFFCCFVHLYTRNVRGKFSFIFFFATEEMNPGWMLNMRGPNGQRNPENCLKMKISPPHSQQTSSSPELHIFSPFALSIALLISVDVNSNTLSSQRRLYT